jgi:Domain of unknown function (DUF4384)
MRSNVMVLGFVCLSVFILGTAAPALQDEDVRGAFLTSRPKEKPKTSGPATKPGRKRPKTNVAPNNPSKSPEKTTATKPATSKPVTSKPATTKPSTPEPPTSTEPSQPVNAPRIGLGLTLFMRDSNGLAMRTDPNRVFQKGDRVRVLLETNADGYLYIFNTTNDGAPVMIYPHADLDEGGNYLHAHVPFEVPASSATDERLRWFAFDDIGGTEHLFFVFTREPLKGIPLEDELIAFCRGSKESCPIKPNSEVWAAIQKEMQEPLKTDKAQKIETAETVVEQQATTRGIGLAKDDPEPSLVLMASSNRPTLVATLDLIHK